MKANFINEVSPKVWRNFGAHFIFYLLKFGR